MQVAGGKSSGAERGLAKKLSVREWAEQEQVQSH